MINKNLEKIKLYSSCYDNLELENRAKKGIITETILNVNNKETDSIWYCDTEAGVEFIITNDGEIYTDADVEYQKAIEKFI